MGKKLLIVMAVALLATPALASSAILEGDYLRVGVSDSGGLIDDGFIVGIDYDKTGTGTYSPSDADFLKPGTPFEFYSIGIGGEPNWNAAGYFSGNAFGGTTSDTTGGSSTNSANTVASWGSLGINQDLWYPDAGVGAGTIKFHVKLTNNGADALTDVVYARGLDPDQDVYAGGGYETTNVIPNGNLVYGSAPITDWTIGIFSDSAYAHMPTVNRDWDQDPYALLTARNDGYGDFTINMAFDIGTLDPRQSADLYFEYRIAETHGGVVGVIPEPASILLLSVAGLGLGIKRIVRRRR